MNLIFIISLYPFLNIIDSLRWNSSEYGNNMDSVISLSKIGQNLRVDVHPQEIIIIKDIQMHLTPIIIYCFIGGYHETSIIEYSFCKDQECSGPYKDGKQYPRTIFQRMTVTAETKFSNRKGIRLTLLLPSDNTDSSGSLYCKAADIAHHLTIRSNNIQIRDRIYWQQNLVRNADNLRTIYQKPISRENLPITLPCMDTGLILNPSRPVWIPQEFPSPVLWSICPVLHPYEMLIEANKATFRKCVEFTTSKWENPHHRIVPRDISKMTKWKYYINDKGDLTIFDIGIESKPLDLSYALMCYTMGSSKAQPINTYISKFKDDNIVSGVIFDGTKAFYDRPLVPISPQLQNITLYIRKLPESQTRSHNQRVAIYEKYISSSNASVVWFYEGSPFHSGVNRISSKFTMEFIRDITPEMGGNYSIVIHDKGKTLTMTIIVTVLGPPILKDSACMPLVHHVWEYDSTSITCNYADRPEELSIQINNQEFKLDTLDKFMNTNLQKTYPYLAELHFNITPTNYIVANTVTMTYSVYQLRKSLGQTKYQDHTVTFFVKNNYGLILKSSSIYTVPKVKDQVKEFPNSFNCTVLCLSSETHHFRCRFNSKEYMNKELKVDHYWTINGHRLGQYAKFGNVFAPYFIVDPITKDLTLLPIRSNDTNRDAFVKKSLKSNFIICNIDIVSSLQSASSFNYMSTNDRLVKDLLRTKIMIDFRPSNVAFISGITIASVALLLVIIVAFILYQRINNVGETYQLEKLERKCGHDAAAELEDERIKSYVYEDNGPYFRNTETTGSSHNADEESI